MIPKHAKIWHLPEWFKVDESGEFFIGQCSDGMSVRIKPVDDQWVVTRNYADGTPQSGMCFPSWRQVRTAIAEQNS